MSCHVDLFMLCAPSDMHNSSHAHVNTPIWSQPKAMLQTTFDSQKKIKNKKIKKKEKKRRRRRSFNKPTIINEKTSALTQQNFIIYLF